MVLHQPGARVAQLLRRLNVAAILVVAECGLGDDVTRDGLRTAEQSESHGVAPDRRGIATGVPLVECVWFSRSVWQIGGSFNKFISLIGRASCWERRWTFWLISVVR